MSSFELTPNNTHALQKETLTCELQKEKSGLQHLVAGELAIERDPWCGAGTRLRWPWCHLLWGTALHWRSSWTALHPPKSCIPCWMPAGCTNATNALHSYMSQTARGLYRSNDTDWCWEFLPSPHGGWQLTEKGMTMRGGIVGSRPFFLARREAGGHMSADPVPSGGRRRRGQPERRTPRQLQGRGFWAVVGEEEPVDLTGSGSRRCGIGKISPDLAHRGTASPRRAARIAWAAPKRTSRWLRGGVVAH